MLVYLAELVVINLRYIASNTSLMSLSEAYSQSIISGYPDSKFTVLFSPTTDKNVMYVSIIMYISCGVDMCMYVCTYICICSLFIFNIYRFLGWWSHKRETRFEMNNCTSVYVLRM